MSAAVTVPQRILLVCHYYAPHIGGIENVVQAEAERLAAAGHEVVVLTSGSRNSVGVEGGVRVVRVAAWNGLEHRAGVPFPVFSPQMLLQAIRLARWAQVVHAHDCFYLSSWSAGIAARLARTPLVLSQHVALVDHPSAVVSAVQKLVYRTAGRALVRRAKRIFVINEHVGEFVDGLGAEPAKVVVLSNGVDTERFRPAADPMERDRLRYQYGLPRGRPLALFVGRLVPKKGVDVLLAAHPAECDLVVVGSGDPSVLDGRPGVHFLGIRPPEQVAEIFRACDLFVLPTTGELLPLVVKEAMSTGLPVVTTDEPGYSLLGIDRDGVALVPREAAAVRAAIAEVVGDEAVRGRMAAYSLDYARKYFSWTEHVDLLRENYRAALGGP